MPDFLVMSPCRSFVAAAVAAPLLVACAASRTAPRPMADAGPDRTPRDAGAPDGGAPPPGVCGAAAAASPFGILAVGVEDRTLVGIGPDGDRQALHGFFGTRVLRDGVAVRGVVAGPDLVAALAHGTPDCDEDPCPRRAEAVLITPDATHVVDVEPVAEHLPFVFGISDDGAAILSMPGEPPTGGGFALLHPGDPEPRRFLERVASYDGAPPDAGGWRRVLVQPTDFALRPAFARLGLEGVRLVPDAPTPVAGWGTRWVFAAEDADGAVSVRIASPDGSVSIPVEGPVEGAYVYGVRDDHAVLWSNVRPHALVDLVRRRVIPLPADALGTDGLSTFPMRFEGGWFVVAADGRPVIRVELETGAVERLDDLLPADAEPFMASYCASAPRVLDGGRLVLGLRHRGEPSGVFAERADGTFERLGLPLHEVLHATARRFGETWLVRGVSGERTFCPRPEPWPGEPPDDALLGDSVQLVPGERSAIALPDAEFVHVDPTGRCALYATPAHGPPTWTMLDVDTHERVRWTDPITWLTGVPQNPIDGL